VTHGRTNEWTNMDKTLMPSTPSGKDIKQIGTSH